MKVIMRTTYAGARGSAQAGGEIDLPEDEAKSLIAGGYAVVFSVALAAVGEPVESAVLPVTGKAVSPAQERPRGRRS